MINSVEKRLEAYTIKHPKEVLIVTILVEKEEETIAIYKGFSSSLSKGTAADPDLPVLPSEAKILKIDRVASPYQPDYPRYLEQGLSWEAMAEILKKLGI